VTKKAPPSFLVTQLEEALEERQKPDRRKRDRGYDPSSKSDRRQTERRRSASAKGAH